MKLKNLLTSFIVLFSISLFVSCDNEPVDPVLTNSLTSQINPSLIDYWPSNLDNEWNYNQGMLYQNPFKIVSTSNINGYTYYNFTNTFGQFDLLDNSIQMQMRKDNGNYYIRRPDSFTTEPGQYTTQVNAIEYLLFNHHKNVGETWSSSYTTNITSTFLNPPFLSYTTTTITNVLGTMLGRNMSVVINNVTYNDILYFRLDITSTGSSSPTTEYYWFSKDIGCVKAIFYDTSIEISSYTLN